jgi:hypothetical protein
MMMQLCEERERVVAKPKKHRNAGASEFREFAQSAQRIAHAAKRIEHPFGQAQWVRTSDEHARVSRHLATLHSAAPTNVVRREFKRLARQWREDRGGISSISRMVLHPAYQRIIGLGPDVVPLLLKDLQTEPEHWGPALSAITGANPIPASAAGNLAAMSAAWVRWGEENGKLG